MTEHIIALAQKGKMNHFNFISQKLVTLIMFYNLDSMEPGTDR